MSKCYLVTDGYYSDYRVVAVFTDRKKAEEFQKLSGSSWLEEMSLDQPFEDPKMDCFKILQHINGEVYSVERFPRLSSDGSKFGECNYRTWKDTDPTCERYKKKIDGQYNLRWIGYAKSEEHARRHVEELRRQILAGQRPAEVDMGKN